MPTSKHGEPRPAVSACVRSGALARLEYDRCASPAWAPCRLCGSMTGGRARYTDRRAHTPICGFCWEQGRIACRKVEP